MGGELCVTILDIQILSSSSSSVNRSGGTGVFSSMATLNRGCFAGNPVTVNGHMMARSLP